MALTLNAKKNKIRKNDFDILGKNLGIPARVVENVYKKFSEILPDLNQWMDISFLPKAMKDKYKNIIGMRAKKIEL
jgi:serine/threonine-protein kinase HipA